MQITKNNFTSGPASIKKATNSKPNNIFNVPQKQEKTKDVFFKGKSYPYGYYSDEEIKDANKYLGKNGWEKEVYDKEYKKKYNEIMGPREKATGWDIALIISLNIAYLVMAHNFKHEAKESAKEKASVHVENVKALMNDLNIEKIKAKEVIKKELEEQIMEKTIETLARAELQTEFLNCIQDNKDVPTAVMITENTKEKREEMINWIKDQVTCRFIETKEETDEDEIANRIEFELRYAKERFVKSGGSLRTILHVKNMDKLLKKDRPDIKALMTALSKEKAPITLLFQTDTISDIANAYISNRTRIPLRIKLDTSSFEDGRP